MEDATLYTIVIAVIGAIGSAIKIYVDYKRNQNALDRADMAEVRAHELNLIKTKAEAALRASVVGIERHKKTMTPESQLALSKSIQDAAIEESAEDFLSAHVDKITKKAGTEFYSPAELKKKLDEESNT